MNITGMMIYYYFVCQRKLWYFINEITRQMDLRLQTTIKHKTLGREVSYEYLIRLEIYKLIKHLLEDVPYEGFKMWWWYYVCNFSLWY